MHVRIIFLACPECSHRPSHFPRKEIALPLSSIFLIPSYATPLPSTPHGLKRTPNFSLSLSIDKSLHWLTYADGGSWSLSSSSSSAAATTTSPTNSSHSIRSKPKYTSLSLYIFIYLYAFLLPYRRLNFLLLLVFHRDLLYSLLECTKDRIITLKSYRWFYDSTIGFAWIAAHMRCVQGGWIASKNFHCAKTDIWWIRSSPNSVFDFHSAQIGRSIWFAICSYGPPPDPPSRVSIPRLGFRI